MFSVCCIPIREICLTCIMHWIIHHIRILTSWRLRLLRAEHIWSIRTMLRLCLAMNCICLNSSHRLILICRLDFFIMVRKCTGICFRIMSCTKRVCLRYRHRILSHFIMEKRRWRSVLRYWGCQICLSRRRIIRSLSW